MDNEKIAYCAGFFDGEGHIRVTKHSTRGSYMLQITAVQATEYPLGLFVELFGGTIAKRVFPYKDTIKALYAWQVSSKSAEDALNKMLPYIICKKDEALLALEFRKTFRPQYGERSKTPIHIVEKRHEIMRKLQLVRIDKRINAVG